ncbi:hypothetical protein BDF19DRAFT_430478 [Syncephalis fuscata]|nr:hypothetical protein BDF19DRAFT_430460 [Syncephalis fuscata]KAI9599219.1 hypothetical protein BDF19DRAFT_430478 [Syncephalis fuscata]
MFIIMLIVSLKCSHVYANPTVNNSKFYTFSFDAYVVKCLNTSGYVIRCYINWLFSNFRTNVGTRWDRPCVKIIFICFDTVYGKMLC